MLRTLCLALLLVSSTALQAHGESDSLAHRAFWYSSNGKPVLDSSGHCIRNGSWQALGGPACMPAAAPEPAAEPAPVAEPESSPAPATEPVAEPEKATTEVTAAATEATTPVAEPEPTAAPEPAPEPAALTTEPVAAVEPEPAEQPAAVTYSYPVESVTTHILFDFDKNNLRIDQQEKIEVAIMQARKAHKIFKVSLDGHADSRGTDDYNYNLSQRRINTIVNYLNLREVSTDTTMAWGESKLILNADGSENYDLSRRVEIMIKVQQKVAN